MGKYAADFGYRMPVLIDHSQILARSVGATVTPEAAVLSTSGQLLYLGRIDDKNLRIGASKYAASEFDLENALKAVPTGKPVSKGAPTQWGCAIPFGLVINK